MTASGGGRLVEVGCGSGSLARHLVDAGYNVVGFDISRAMIRLAREKVPEAKFRVASLTEARMPRCDAVVAIGEVVTYVPARGRRTGPPPALRRFFSRVHEWCRPSGLPSRCSADLQVCRRTKEFLMSLTRRELFELAGALALPRPQSADTRSLDDTARRAADVIKGYSAEGMHRTGTAVDRASADRLLALARAAGASPSLAPFDLSRVDPATSFLEIDGRRVEGLPMFDAAFTPAAGVAGAIGPLDGDRPIAWTRVAPNGEAALRRVRQASRHRAIVVVTMGGKPGLCPVNAASFTEPFGPPVLQIGSEHLAAMEEASGAGRSVRVVAHVSRTPATAFNLVAEVRGTQPQSPPVCVMTPRSGWYANASERGGGLACWLEAVRAVAATRPQRTVRFVASSGHELGHLGLHSYLDRDPAVASGALVWVHLGANIGASTGDTGLTASDSRLSAAAVSALAPYALDRIRQAPAAQVGGEAATIGAKGGRFISFIGRNDWFHHPGDVWPDVVDIGMVARFARAAGDLTLALANSGSLR